MQLITAIRLATGKTNDEIKEAITTVVKSNPFDIFPVDKDILDIDWDAPEYGMLSFICGLLLPLNLFKAAKTAKFYQRKDEFYMITKNVVLEIVNGHNFRNIAQHEDVENFEYLEHAAQVITHTEFFDAYFTASQKIKLCN